MRLWFAGCSLPERTVGRGQLIDAAAATLTQADIFIKKFDYHSFLESLAKKSVRYGMGSD